MQYFQKTIQLNPKSRGFHLVTSEIIGQIEMIKSIKIGLCHLFIKHTSAGLSINENADPTVREDFESYFNNAVPENEPYYKHNSEGSDDMPAHIKSAMLGHQTTIPITNGRLNLGIWQGIYLCEHRNAARSRSVVVTAYGTSKK